MKEFYQEFRKQAEESQKQLTDLSKKRGFIVIDRDTLNKQPTEEFLKLIFSVFFPVAMENYHVYNMYDGLKMYGFSKHFRDVNEGEIIPEYEMILTFDEKNSENKPDFRFLRMEEVKK